MSQKYKVAVIGCTGRGNYGHGLDTSWLKVPQAEIVAVADADAGGRAKAAERLKIERTYADYRKMLDETKPDIVTLASRWVDQHHEMAMAAIERGIHIYIEKPFCRTLQEADEVAQACEMRHVKLNIAHPTHYSPTMQTVKRLIREGAIGDVLELRGRGKEDRRGGGEDLWVLGSHIFDMMLTLGYEPTWCFASITEQGQPLQKSHIVPGAEGIGLLAGDAVRAMYGLAQGITASFQTYRHKAGQPSRFGLRVYGSKGIIEIFEGTLPPIYILQDDSWSTRADSSRWQKISTAGIDQPELLTDPKYRDRHYLAMIDLINSIEKHHEPLCNARQGVKITEMVLAPFESQRLGQPVAMPLQNRQHPLELY